MKIELPKLTGVEVLVIIAIIGILTAMIVPVVVNAHNYTDVGVITNKRYKAAWTEMRSVNYGKHLQTVPIHHPERWKITIMNGEKYATFNVSESVYNKLNVGDEFNATEMGVSRQ